MYVSQKIIESNFHLLKTVHIKCSSECWKLVDHY